jgi:hypothetical protein
MKIFYGLHTAYLSGVQVKNTGRALAGPSHKFLAARKYLPFQ